MRKVVVKVEGREHVVELEGEGAALRARLGEREVEVIEAEAGVWVVREGNEQAVVQIDGAGGKRTAEVRAGGRDSVVVNAEVVDGRKRGGAAVGAVVNVGPVVVRAGMPGKVVKVVVAKDQSVAAGQTVVVVEAMKMENEIKAPRAGKIAGVACAEGSSVEAGEELVTIV
jgi:biotin carboxyl carrier protein